MFKLNSSETNIFPEDQVPIKPGTHQAGADCFWLGAIFREFFPGASIVKIHQRGVQWKQGVVICMVLYTSLLYNTTLIHCTPLPLHPPLMNTQGVAPRGSQTFGCQPYTLVFYNTKCIILCYIGYIGLY